MKKLTNLEVVAVIVIASILGGILYGSYNYSKDLDRQIAENEFELKSEALEKRIMELEKAYEPEEPFNLDWKPPVVTRTEVITISPVYEEVVEVGNTLSDEEIRILREKQSFKPGGSYIYTPGRNVPSYDELHEKAIEEYLEKNR